METRSRIIFGDPDSHCGNFAGFQTAVWYRDGVHCPHAHAVSDTGDTLRWLSVDASAVFAAEVDNRNVLYRGAYSKLHYVPQSIVCIGLCTVTRLASDCLMYGP